MMNTDVELKQQIERFERAIIARQKDAERQWVVILTLYLNGRIYIDDLEVESVQVDTQEGWNDEYTFVFATKNKNFIVRDVPSICLMSTIDGNMNIRVGLTPPEWPIKKLNDHIFMTDEGFLVQYPSSNQLLLNMA